MEDGETECDEGDEDESICILSPVAGKDDSTGSIRTPRVLGSENCVVVREKVCGHEECPITTERVCIEEEREVSA